MCNTMIVSRKNFIAIASLFYPVDMTKSQKIISDDFKLMRITATQMITHYSVNFDPIHKYFTLLAI